MANRKKGGAAHRSFLALPRLRAGHGLQAPVTSQWTENDRALALISRSIDVLNSAEKGHSIPDIFSQSIQFEFDLGIGNARAVEQWQGLLATLLLAGAGGQARVRPLDMDALGDAPFARIFRAVAARRGIEGMTLFELRRTDGSWGAVAFRFAGMPTMLCPAAEIRGPFVVDDPWLRQTERGWTFDAPLALVDDPRYGERRLALRNEIYALATREIPARENRDGLQMIRLRAFFEFLSRGGDGISPYPVNAEVRAALFTQDAAAARPSSLVFTDRICLLREGNAYNRIHACAVETMRIFTGAQDSGWRALLPLRRAFAERELDKLRAGTLRVRLRWHNGAVEAELQDEGDRVLESRLYRIQDLVNYARHRNAPQTAVWPPKALEGWNRYYLLRYDDGNALPLAVQALEMNAGPTDLALLPRMPRGLAFSLEGEEMGVLLCEYETMVNPRARAFTLGFDFGTTGTTAYKCDAASGTVTPVSFEEDGALFLFGREEGADVALTANLVCEHIAARATHFTLLRQKGEADAGALLGATIPFVTSAAFNPELVRDVSDDLKWGTLSADKVRANLFLEQYLMMCLWHACRCGAASISWRASYPLSMHGRLQEEFIAKVQTLTAGLCTHCYRMPYETYFCSESEAVGFMMMDNAIQSRFLRGVTINDETGFFCLDIGGGSTDFSLWQHRRPLMQASLRWAGNAILCESVTRENHGEGCAPREEIIDSFFATGGDGRRDALAEPLRQGRFDEFRRVWNVLVDEITDAMKGVRRTAEPLAGYLNIVRFNLYMLLFFAGRMVGKALEAGCRVGMQGAPLPVCVLGNGAKMMTLLYNDVERIQRSTPDGGMESVVQERCNPARYEEEMGRFLRVFKAGCATEGFEAVIIEPFMPKQEAARGLALAPEAFLSRRARQDLAEQDAWPAQSAYEREANGVVCQTMTDDFRALLSDSFLALRAALTTEEELRAFLASLFPQPEGDDRYQASAYFRSIWGQCLRQNPEPTLPGQPLPARDTVSGRFVEALAAMNRMMRAGQSA